MDGIRCDFTSKKGNVDSQPSLVVGPEFDDCWLVVRWLVIVVSWAQF